MEHSIVFKNGDSTEIEDAYANDQNLTMISKHGTHIACGEFKDPILISKSNNHRSNLFKIVIQFLQTNILKELKANYI